MGSIDNDNAMFGLASLDRLEMMDGYMIHVLFLLLLLLLLLYLVQYVFKMKGPQIQKTHSTAQVKMKDYPPPKTKKDLNNKS